MDFNRTLRYGQIAVVMACLVVPAAMFAAGGRSPLIDNRPLTVRPSIGGTKLLDTTVTDQIDQFLDDGFPLRDEAVELDARVAQVLGDSPNELVQVGREGWLFLRLASERPCLTSSDVESLEEAIDRVGNVFLRVDKELILVIAPDKATIYSDLYGSDSDLECILQTADQLGTLETKVTMVTTWPETRAVARSDPAAYLRLDTHWTSVGATPTAKAIIDELAPGLWQADHLVVTEQIDSPGDLASLQGREESEPELFLAADPAPDETVTTPFLVTDRNGEIVEKASSVSYRSTWSEAIEGDTVFLGDSFGFRLATLVAPYFAHVERIRGVSPHELDIRSAIQQSDLVIRERVQRDFVFDLRDGDLAAEFVIAFIDQLDAFDVAIDCSDGLCRALPGAPSDVGDRYVIATLADGVESAAIRVNGFLREVDLETPATGWIVGDGDMVIEGDPALFDWSGAAVSTD